MVEDRLRRLGRGLGLIVGVLAALVTFVVMGASTAAAAEPDGRADRQDRQDRTSDSESAAGPHEDHDTTTLDDRSPGTDTGEAPATAPATTAGSTGTDGSTGAEDRSAGPTRRSATRERSIPEPSREADAAAQPDVAPTTPTTPPTVAPTPATTTAPEPSGRTWNADPDPVDSDVRAVGRSGRGSLSDDGAAVGDDLVAADARGQDRGDRRRDGRWGGAPDRAPEPRGDERDDGARASATELAGQGAGRAAGPAAATAGSTERTLAVTDSNVDLPTDDGWDMASLHRLSEFSAAIVPELSWTSMVQERPDTAVPDGGGSAAGSTPWGRAFAEGGQISAAGGAMAFAAVLFQREGDPAPPEWRLLDEERSPHLPCFYESNRVPG